MEDIEITCPNCKIQLPAELKRVLISGTAVTCENCGVVLVPKVQGEPSQVPAEKAAKPASVREAIKQAFREAKASIAAETSRPQVAAPTRHAPGARTAQPGRPAPAVAAAQPAPELPREPPSAPASPGTSETPQGHREHEPRVRSKPRKKPKRGTANYIANLKQEIEEGKKGLRTYNEVSKILLGIWLALFYIASISTVLFEAFSGRPFLAGLVQQAPLYIIGAFMYWYETHRLHEWIKQGVYEFYGVDIIVVGILGCSVYGAGVLMLVKGVVVMGIMLMQDEVAPKSKRDVLIGWINGFDEVAWYIAAIAAAAAFILTASSIIAGIFSFTGPSAQFVAFIIMGICGIVAANSDLTKVSRYCREYRFEGLGGKALVYGVIGCVCFGAGVPMIV
ncbi:MAG: hypothetical protein JW839_11385, partial [Candidatus Lokiarchaeota archaeon]|nr:hypothetical protein [Candidatus Lokiarchaeota archaeon]